MKYNQTLAASVAAAINTPADPRINGAILQEQLLAMIDGFDAGALFMGLATPATIPSTEANCFFLATQSGTYTNFLNTGGQAITVAEGEVAFIKSTIYQDNLRWNKITVVTGLGENQVVSGYYNPVDGKFYEEDTFATEITGDSDNIYIDIATNSMFRYDSTATAYEPLGDSVVDKRVNGTVTPDKYKRTSNNVGSYAEYDITGNSDWRYIDLSIKKGETVFYKCIGHYGTIQPASFVDPEGILRFKIDAASGSGGETHEGSYTATSDGVFTINVRHDQSGWDDAYLYVIRASSERKVNGIVIPSKYKRTSNSVGSYAEYDVIGNSDWRYIDLSVKKGETMFYKCIGHYGTIQPASFVDSEGILRFKIDAPSGSGGETHEGSYTAPDNGVFTINVRHDQSGWDDVYLYTLRSGSGGGASEATVSYLTEVVDGIQGRNGVRFDMASMVDGDDIDLTNIFPHMNKFGNKIQLTCKVETMGTLKFWFGSTGTGFVESYGYHLLTIDSSDVKLYKLTSTSTLVETVAHGLLISGYLSVNLDCLDDGTMKVQMNSLDNMLNVDGKTYITLQEWNYGVGRIKLELDDSAELSEVQLSVTNEMFRSPFWMVGASQEGLDTTRFAGQLMKMGYLNCFVNARSGRTSQYAIEDLQRALTFGHPKYLYFSLSNDGFDPAVYEARLQTVKAIAEEKEMELIVKAVAVVQPTVDYDATVEQQLAKRQYIFDNIERVFDFGKAVSADPTDPTAVYSGYLDAAGIHPANALAANAVAMQFCADVPEIMQYGAKQKVVQQGGGATPQLATPILYADLVTLRNGGNLVPGTWYRITDYACTTTQEDTQSANHTFDIIVRADDASHLNENAYAAHHTGDTYFATCKLEAWELKYSLDNDTNRFVWADTSNGKGVIYYMKDEWGNIAPFDFKNMLFTRDSEWFGGHGTWAGDVLGEVPETDLHFYFLSWVTENGEVQDASIVGQTLTNDEGTYTGVYGNEIKETTACDMGIEDATSTAFALPCTIIVSSYAYEEGVFYGCYGNTFGNYCSFNTFGNDCNFNTFGNSCGNNTFGNVCSNNTFRDDCSSNMFRDACSNNTFGNDFQNNTFGIDCFDNSFGNGCNSNTFGNYCQTITVFDGVQNCSVTGGSDRSPVKNAQILNGTAGRSGQLLTISFTPDVSYAQVAGYNTSGTLKIWNPAEAHK